MYTTIGKIQDKKEAFTRIWHEENYIRHMNIEHKLHEHHLEQKVIGLISMNTQDNCADGNTIHLH